MVACLTGSGDGAKAHARAFAMTRRKAAHQQGHAAAEAARQSLVELVKAAPGGPVSGYMPIRTEIDILPAMVVLAGQRVVCVPFINGPGQPLDFHRWHPGETMHEGPFGALVPSSAVKVVPRVLIVPLLAFDPRGYRLGYGGGFYDRTLERLRTEGPVLAVGFAYAAQRLDHVPTEPTDQPLDAIVTEEGVSWFG